VTAVVARYPWVLSYSMDKRLAPRFKAARARGASLEAAVVGLPKDEEAFRRHLEVRGVGR
jgi:hypothetical protein